MPEELLAEVCNSVQETVTKTIPKRKKHKTGLKSPNQLRYHIILIEIRAKKHMPIPKVAEWATEKI